MGHIKDKPVLGGVKHRVQGNGGLHQSQIGTAVAAVVAEFLNQRGGLFKAFTSAGPLIFSKYILRFLLLLIPGELAGFYRHLVARDLVLQFVQHTLRVCHLGL